MPASVETVKRILRRIWPSLLVLAIPAIASAAVSLPAALPRMASSDDREHQLWKTRVRDSQFSEVPHINARSRCEDVQPPQPLTTPEPVLNPRRDRRQPKPSVGRGT